MINDPDEVLSRMSVDLRLDGFAWRSLAEEAARDDLTVEELVTFSVLYYLADRDSGRMSRRIASSPHRPTSQLDRPADERDQGLPPEN